MRKTFGLCLVGVLALAGRAISDEDGASYAATQDAALARADVLERSDRYEEAVPIYESLINEGSGRDLHWMAYLLFRLSCAQYEQGDRAGALESAAGAVNLDASEPSYQAFLSDLRDDGSGTKRSTVYRAHRDEGSARRLVSTNGVLHIFVRGRDTERWDPEEEEKIQFDISGADAWLKARAAENDPVQTPVFEHRYLTVADEPFWRKINVPGPDSNEDYRKAWMNDVLTRFQASSFAELFDRVFEGMPLANRCVIFHTSQRDIAFAVTPYRRETRDLESAIVATEKTEWINPYGGVSYARELVHLYGADSLFNKAYDPHVPETDLMNFGAHRLDDCVLCALTRYAIGWTDQPPPLAHLHVAVLSHNAKPKKGAHG